jgi:hypothetical protein
VAGIIYAVGIAGFIAALAITGIAAGLYYPARCFVAKHLETVIQTIQRRHK